MSLKEKDKKELKNKVLPPCRVTENELDFFKSKAKASGLSLSDFQRHSMINLKIKFPTNQLEPSDIMKLSDIGNSLKAIPYISNNLNQLIRKEHIHDEADTERMRHLLAELEIANLSKIKKDLESIIIKLL